MCTCGLLLYTWGTTVMNLLQGRCKYQLMSLFFGNQRFFRIEPSLSLKKKKSEGELKGNMNYWLL